MVFTEDYFQYLKMGKVIKQERWNDYNAASFRRGYKGNIIVTLLNLKNTDDKMIISEENKNHKFVLGDAFLATKDGKKLIKFLEKNIKSLALQAC